MPWLYTVKLYFCDIISYHSIIIYQCMFGVTLIVNMTYNLWFPTELWHRVWCCYGNICIVTIAQYGLHEYYTLCISACILIVCILSNYKCNGCLVSCWLFSYMWYKVPIIVTWICHVHNFQICEFCVSLRLPRGGKLLKVILPYAFWCVPFTSVFKGVNLFIQ